MFSAAELIEALRRRRTLKSIRPESPGTLPPGWQAWLAAMPERVGAVTGATPDAILGIFLRRPLATPSPRDLELNRWQAFASLWRQQWHPASADERSVRVIGLALDFLIHLVLAALLVWLMYVRFMAILPPAGEQAAVQVEYIGRGTPEETGAGAPPAEQVAQPSPPRPAAAAASPAPAPPRLPRAPQVDVELAAPQPVVAVPPVPRREVPMPQPPAPSPQPLQVTEVPQPDIDFVLPRPSPRIDPLPRPELSLPEPEIPTPALEVVEVPAELPSLPVPVPSREITAPEVPQPELALPQRPVPAPVPIPRLPTRDLPTRVVTAPELRAPVQSIRPARIPAPAAPAASTAPSRNAAPATVEAAAAAAATDAAASDAAAAADASAPASASAPQAAAGTTPAPAASAGSTPAATTGTGPETGAPPGAWPTPTPGDDWGEALRNRPGGQDGRAPGLFDDEGRPRLADAPPATPASAPPGSAERQRIDLDRAGTWLRRPPYDYTPTRFDKFWIPTGTLLEEWVRKGMREVSIPIPGTSKSIECVVSILQLGGGCALSDPNLNDQPATARPPPDIPFKPELQEDQDALARPPGG